MPVVNDYRPAVLKKVETSKHRRWSVTLLSNLACVHSSNIVVDICLSTRKKHVTSSVNYKVSRHYDANQPLDLQSTVNLLSL